MDVNKPGPNEDILSEVIQDPELLNSVRTAYAQNFRDYDNGFADLVDQSKDKKIDCPREIVFKIEGTVLNQNDKQEITGAEFIFDQSYHIPVPTGVEYQTFVNAFISRFVESLENTSNEAWKDHA